VITRRSTRPEHVTKAFGRELSKILFDGDLGILFDRCRENAKAQNANARVLLHVEGPNACRIPWEFAIDPITRDDYLALRVPVARSVHLMEPVQPLRVDPPLRVLGVMSRPKDLPPLQAEQERERISHAFQQLSSNLVHVEWLESDRWHDLTRRLQNEPWHILHFVGHGGFDEEDDEGYLELTGDDGKALQIPASELAHFTRGNPQLRLVVLNACESATAGTTGVFSSTAARLMREGVPAVVAMQYEITDPAALTFGSSFYEEIAHGVPVDRAVTTAREAVMATLRSLEWATPVLFLASEETRIFAVPGSPSLQEPPEQPKSEQPHSLDSAGTATLADWSTQMRTKLNQYFKGSTEPPVPSVATPPRPQPAPVEQQVASDERATGLSLPLLWASPAAGKSTRFAVGRKERFALACADGNIRIVSLNSRREIARCCLPRREPPTDLAWSPWLRHIASCHDGGLVVVWDLELEVPLRVLSTSARRNTSLAFSNNGKWLAVAGEDLTIHVFNAAGATVRMLNLSPGAPSQVWQSPLAAVTGLAFTPEDRNLMAAGDDGLVRQFDIRGKITKTWQHPQAVSALVAASDRIVTASSDGRIHVWAWDGRLLHRTVQGGPTQHAAYSEHYGLLATLTHDQRCNVWDRDGTMVASAAVAGRPIGVGFASADLLTSTTNGVVEAWSLSTLLTSGGGK
jgi:hypothetical protein